MRGEGAKNRREGKSSFTPTKRRMEKVLAMLGGGGGGFAYNIFDVVLM